MYVSTASPRPKRTAFDGSRGGGECALCSPPLDPPLSPVLQRYSPAKLIVPLPMEALSNACMIWLMEVFE